MKKNILLIAIICFLFTIVGCSDESTKSASKAPTPAKPPATFMNKQLVVDGMMDVVKSSFMNRMQIDEKSIDTALNEFTLQAFLDGKSLEQQGMKLTGWDKDPAGWKLNFDDPDQQKSAHLVFEAGYDGEVKIKEFVFGGKSLPQDNIARIYAAGFGGYLESKGFGRK